MIIALLADLHGNLEAFEACLADLERRGADRVVILGDLVGYGADPLAVTRLVMMLAAKGAVVVRGNHDEAAVSESSRMTPDAEAAIAWTRTVLDTETRGFLESLPMQVVEEDRLFVHADASAPASWRYVGDAEAARRSLEATEARLTFVGHTHKPRLFRLSMDGGIERLRVPAGQPVPLSEAGNWLAVQGAVGQPRDENPAAFYALFDVGRCALTWVRVPFDVETAAAKIRAAGLPERLASRLIRGW